MPRSGQTTPVPSSRLPRLPPGHIPRPGLVERLAAQDAQLRLLSAPAGFGKSVLLNEFLRTHGGNGRVIWLNLAGQALSPVQLIAHLASELDRDLPALPAPQALQQLLAQRDAPLWLVLDDYPGQPPAELDDCIDQLLARALPELRLLVSTRQRPDWNLPRLLLAGELLELDARQLAFDREHYERLVDRLAPRTAAAARDELWRATEGWCAGVRLQLTGGSPSGAQGNHCWLKEYLDHELLNRLSEDEAQCLFALAHLPKVSAALCQQLWEDCDGTALFERLLARQAFCMPLDEHGSWYRVLPVVARVLRHRLSEAAATRLHLAACRVFIAAGQVEDAIEQALCAGQPEAAANYLERLGQEWLTGEQHLARLLAWRSRLPGTLLESTPRLLTLNAWGLLVSWRLDEADACIAKLGHFLPQPSARRNRKLLANWQALRGVLIALRSQSATHAVRHCREALAELPEHDWMAILFCHSTLARIALAEGAQDEVQTHLHQALEIARRHGSLLFEVLINLDCIRLLLLRGEHGRAQALLDQSLVLIGQRKQVDSLLLGRLHLIQAELHLIADRLDDAEHALHTGLREARACADPFALAGFLGLAELHARRGHFDQAFQELREAERHMHCHQVWRYAYSGLLNLQRMRVLARQGRWERIGPVALRIRRYFVGERPWMPQLDYPTLPLRNQLLLARSRLETGLAEEAEALLLPLLDRCKALQFIPLVCEVQLALAAAWHALGRDEAQGLQRQALEQAERLGLAGLLRDQPDAGQAAGSGGQASLLSQRERAVLQLLAEGFSNQEIGGTLFISVNTVKTHTKKINSKLGVKRRTQAVMRAKALGLLV
ncbi:LuxR C-terminal-related transcriptional regulator [Metapseudomonas furukawaii]